MSLAAEVREQALTGVVPSNLGEAIIRDVWASMTASPGAARLAKTMQRSIIFAPLGWLLLLPGFTLRLMGVVTRYRLTNRRLMVCKGMKAKPTKELPLDQIRDVRVVTDSYDDFYRSATLEIINPGGQVALTLPAVREPESLRHSILQAAQTWGPLLKQS